PAGLASAYEDTPFTRKILQAPQEYLSFALSEGLLFLMNPGETSAPLVVPNAIFKGRRVRELCIDHAHMTLSHAGYRKTLDYLRKEYWW
ncbi:hypothetical protein CALVIDRAFT_473249, partial [Calocera viscosa TUFC12733]